MPNWKITFTRDSGYMPIYVRSAPDAKAARKRVADTFGPVHKEYFKSVEETDAGGEDDEDIAWI